MRIYLFIILFFHPLLPNSIEINSTSYDDWVYINLNIAIYKSISISVSILEYLCLDPYVHPYLDPHYTRAGANVRDASSLR